MKLLRHASLLSVAIFLLGAAHTPAHQQGTSTDTSKQQVNIDQTSHVTVEVSGGEDDKPIENASVYIKYVEERKIKKDKKVELNVKTNREGAAHVPTAPMGRALIQVVADGWKTFGRWYDITEPKQTFKIHLEKPPKWY